MPCKSVFDRMAQCIAKVLAIQQPLSPESSAADYAGWDSVTHTYVVLALEEEFGVQLPVEKTIEAETLDILAEMIRYELSQQASHGDAA